MSQNYHQLPPAASLLRRLAALFYDALIVIGLLICATILAVIINRGQAIAAGNYLFSFYLIAVMFSYFCYSWVGGGQTIGMRAWHLEIRSFSGEPIDYWHAAMRFGYAIPSLILLGVGFWWLALDPKRLTWYDRWSGTYISHKK